MVELHKQNYEKNVAFYKTIETKLRKRIMEEIPIDHVGSTAIPFIEYGKNIMDIAIGAKDEKQFEDLKAILVDEGYVPSEKSRDEIYQFLSSTAAETGEGDIHIHLVIMNTERYNEFIILKKYLLHNANEAKAYSDFKVKILDLGTTDRKEYKRVKSEYVTNLLNRAKEWYESLDNE